MAMVPLLGVYLSTRPVMQLQAEAPAEVIDQSPNWNAKRRAQEEQLAQAYWRAAVIGLQGKYQFGNELPAEAPVEFQVEKKDLPAGSVKAYSEARARYWGKLRQAWVQPQSWVKLYEWNTDWAARLRHIWDQGSLHK
jgi:hypothetical protein